MAKVTGPFLSLDARGTIAKTLTATAWKGINVMRQRVVPSNPKTFKQTAIRDLMRDASQAWFAGSTVGTVVINSTYKSAFDLAAEGKAYSGFNLYMKLCVAHNFDSTTSPYYDGTLVVPVDPTDLP